MSKKSTNKHSDLFFSYIKIDQAVTGMTQLWIIKVVVTRKKCRTAELVQKRDDFAITHPFPADFIPNLPNRNPPATQQTALAIDDILVENIHAATGSIAYWSACSKNACRERRTASAIASWEMLPRHSSMILSHASPSATCSSTSATKMRVPRNVGLPRQISGSDTMYRPKSVGCIVLGLRFILLKKCDPRLAQKHWGIVARVRESG